MNHLFVSSGDGALYDTRVPDWHRLAPLRPVFKRHYVEIRSVAEFKATLRAGAYAWPGGYQLYLICSDGAPLCFACGRKEARCIFSAIDQKDGSGWRVLATDVNYEDMELNCSHCGEIIPASYGD